MRSINHSNKIIIKNILHCICEKWKPYTHALVNRKTTKCILQRCFVCIGRSFIIVVPKIHRSLLYTLYTLSEDVKSRGYCRRNILWVVARTASVHRTSIYVYCICIIVYTLIKRRIYLSPFSRSLFARLKGCARV